MAPAMIALERRFLLHSDEADIKTVSLVSGDNVAVLRGHKSAVVGMGMSPWDVTQVISRDADGEIRVWDFAEAKCLRTVQAPEVVELQGSFVVTKEEPAAAEDLEGPVENGADTRDSSDRGAQGRRRKRREASESLALHEFEFTSKAKGKQGLVLKPAIWKRRGDKPLAQLAVGGPGTRYVVAVQGKELLVYDREAERLTKLRRRRAFTCVAIHPTEDVLAAGDEEGAIVLFRKDGDSFTEAAGTVLHWHAHAVSSIAFSSDGTHFVSGGLEAVLVIWQTDTGHRTFLPRLGGPITRVAASPDGARFALCTKTNMIRVVDARTMSLEHVIQCLASSQVSSGLAQHGEDRLRQFGVVFEPRTGAVVLQKVPGTLQLLDLESQRQVSAIDVTRSNTVSETEKGKPVVPAFVEKVAFAPRRGEWMVTAERRKRKSTLKFWALQRGSQKAGGSRAAHGEYVLCTQVAQPHADDIVSLLFHPSGEMVVSASKDHRFKIWKPEPGTNRWNCDSVGFYRKSPIRAAALSPDGSLLAVVNDNLVSLWNPHDNTVLEVLTHVSKANSPVTFITFFRQNLLATCTSDGSLMVWSAADASLVWSLRLGDVSAVTATKTQLLVMTPSKLLVFSGDGPVPVKCLLAPAGVSCAVAAVGFSPRLDEFVLVSENGSLHRFEQPTESERNTTANRAATASTFALLNPSSDNRNAGERGGTAKSAVSGPEPGFKSTLGSLEGFPSHVLPPISRILDSMFEATRKTQLANEASSNKRKAMGEAAAASEAKWKRVATNKGAVSQVPGDFHSDGTVVASDTDDVVGRNGPGADEQVSKGRSADIAVESAMTTFFRSNLWEKRLQKK